MGTTSTAGLAGARVLLVEDELVVAMLFEEMLADLGCKVVGPISRLDAARQAIADHKVDCALLDINVHGEPVYPLVELLDKRAVPFAFVTGYGAGGVETPFDKRPVVQKPFMASELKSVLQRLLGARGKKPAAASLRRGKRTRRRAD